PEGMPVGVAVSADGARVASLDSDLRIWDRVSGKLVARFSTGESFPWCLAFTPDGKKVLTGQGANVLIWEDLATGMRRKLWRDDKTPGLPNRIVFSKDGKK